jgi:hypothetical protein
MAGVVLPAVGFRRYCKLGATNIDAERRRELTGSSW